MCSFDLKKKKTETDKRRSSRKKYALPSVHKKGPCAQLLNVGVPKILLDRKFPILRCFKELQPSERSYSNPVIPNRFPASTPPVLHSVPLSYRTLDFICSMWKGSAASLLIACRQAPGTACFTKKGLLIVNRKAYFSVYCMEQK